MGKRIDREELTPEYLRRVLNYDPKTGDLLWKERPTSSFSCLREANRWNNRYAGTAALSHPKRGYLTGSIGGRYVAAHRVVWAMFYGAWPNGQIDHINGDRSDNRIENLRVVDSCENNRNRKVPKNNTSGVMGVARDPEQPQKWRASISRGGRSRIIGRFDCIWQAISARKQAERALGYHKNHGRRV